MRALASVLICALFVLPGCAAMKEAGRPAGDAVLKEAAAGPKAATTSPRSIKASAIVEISRIFSVKGRALIAAESPDRFRIEVLGPLNSTVALFVSNGAGLYIFSDGQSARYDWDDPRAPFPFRPAEVVSALLGARPPDGGRYGFSTDKAGRVTELIRQENGESVIKAAMSDYRTVSGADVPFAITMKDRRKDLGVKYSSVEVNPDFAPGFFDTDRLP